MKNKRRAAVSLLAASTLILSGVSAWAGTSYSSYSTTVASFGGYGYTAYQTKANANSAADLSSTVVGANYVLSARTNSTEGVGTWTGYVVNDNTTHKLANSLRKGASVQAQFKNRPQTAVAVQASGSWRSN